MELLLLLVPVAVIGVAVIAFKKFWPSAPEQSATTTSSLLSGTRQLTTGQIARGVFWGMWLFTLSQMILAGVVMVFVIGITGAMFRSAIGG